MEVAHQLDGVGNHQVRLLAEEVADGDVRRTPDGFLGQPCKVLVEKQRAVVEGVNMVSKATKPNAKNPQGGIVKQEASIHISNLNPVENGRPVRVGRVVKDGKLVRVSKKTGKEI